jgi:ABC-2 type transport system permease protein
MSDAPAVFHETGIAASTLKLLRMRLIILFNGIRRAKRRAKIGYTVAFFAIASFVGMSLFLSAALLGFLRSPLLASYFGDTTPLVESFPSLIMSIAAVGILFTSFSVLLQTLYLSGDMDFLMSSPVPIRAVFIAKLVQAVLPNFVFLCVLAIPPLFGLGISSGYHFLYYPFVVIMLMAVALAAASLASLLVLVVVRLFPPRRVSEVIGFVIGLVVLLGSQAPQHVNFDASHATKQQIAAMISVFERFNHSWSPLAWAGRGLVCLGKGEWLVSTGLLAASLILVGILFCVALSTSERLYHTGWANVQTNHRKSKNKTKSVPSGKVAVDKGVHPLVSLIPAPVRAILAKDLRLCRRDLGNLSGLISPLVLGIIYAMGLVRTHGQMPPGRGHAPAGFIHAGNAILGYGDIGLALFLGWMLVANLAGQAFNREGKNYWMLKAAPVSARQILASKFMFSYLPSALLCSVYLIVLEVLKRANPWSAIVNLISVCMLIAGLTGIYLSFGTRGAKFDWENPAQRSRAVGCLGMIAGMLFVGLGFALFVAPVALAQVLQLPVVAGQLAGLLLGAIANALAVIIPLGIVEKRVATLAEN